MLAYILRRLFQSVIVLLAMGLVAFSMFRFLGDPVDNLLGQEATQEDIDRLRGELGLDRPLPAQYLGFMARAAQGDFGVSYEQGRPVVDILLERLPATLELALVSGVFAIAIGIALGVLTAIRCDGFVVQSVMALSLVGVSLPTFLTGLLTASGLKALILPAITLGLYQMTLIMRLVRSEMQEVLRQDYIRFARACGLTSRAVHFRHALVNTLVPVTTVIGLQLGSIIAFGIVTETVFQWPVQGWDTRGLAEGLLEQVGLSAGDAARFPHEFSGGQRQRICIARALSSRPRLIICDEPTSALDMSVQAQVLNLMNDLKDELGLTYLFISHDLTVVRHMADRVGVLYLGLLVEEAATRDLFDDPKHPYTRMLIDVAPRIDAFGTEPPVPEGEIASPINQPPGYLYNPRCPSCVDVGLSEKPELALLRGARVACHRAQ